MHGARRVGAVTRGDGRTTGLSIGAGALWRASTLRKVGYADAIFTFGKRKLRNLYTRILSILRLVRPLLVHRMASAGLSCNGYAVFCFCAAIPFILGSKSSEFSRTETLFADGD